MKTELSITAALCGLVSAAFPAEAQEARFDALANSPQFENRPTPDAAAALMDELLFQRATQTYLWAMPLINTMGMKVGSEEKFGAGYHVLPVWKKRLERQDARHHAQLGRDLRHELRRPRQGRAARLRRAADAAGHPARLLAASDPRADAPRPELPGRRRLRRSRPGQGRQVPAPAAGLQRRRSPMATSSSARRPTTSSSSCAGSTRIRPTSAPA